MESHASQVAPNARGFDEGLRLGACLDIPHSDENTNSAPREGTRPTSADPCCRPRANRVRQGGCCLGHTCSTGKGLEILTSLSGDKSVELRSKAKAPPLGAPGLKNPVSFSAMFFGDSVLWPAPV